MKISFAFSRHAARRPANSLLILFFLLALSRPMQAQQRQFQLPAEAGKELQDKFGHWKYGDVAIPIYSDQTGMEIRKEFADLIRGDFNGDGRRDYAGIFTLKDSTQRTDYLIVLLASPRGFDGQILEEVSLSATPVLTLIPRGTVEQELGTDRMLKYKYDAIGFGYFEKAGVTWFYQDGKFLQITTGD